MKTILFILLLAACFSSVKGQDSVDTTVGLEWRFKDNVPRDTLYLKGGRMESDTLYVHGKKIAHLSYNQDTLIFTNPKPKHRRRKSFFQLKLDTTMLTTKSSVIPGGSIISVNDSALDGYTRWDLRNYEYTPWYKSGWAIFLYGIVAGWALLGVVVFISGLYSEKINKSNEE